MVDFHQLWQKITAQLDLIKMGKMATIMHKHKRNVIVFNKKFYSPDWVVLSAVMKLEDY